MYSDWDEFGVLRELIGGALTSLKTSWVKWLGLWLRQDLAVEPTLTKFDL